MGYFVTILLSGFVLWLVFSTANFLFLLKRAYSYSKSFSKKGAAFERLHGQPIIFVYGDSTTFGVGSSSPDKSLVGLLGAYYPDASIINRSKIGLTVAQVRKSMSAKDHGRLIIVGCGGIDLLYLKPLRRIRADIKELFGAVAEKGDKVIVITPLNPGLSTIFPTFISWYYLKRASRIGKIFQEESRPWGNISVLNLLAESAKTAPPWAKITAPDKIHPNDLGHSWTFEKLRSLL